MVSNLYYSTMDAEKKRRLWALRIGTDLTLRHPPRDELARLIQERTVNGALLIETLRELAEQDEDPEVREEAQAYLRDLVADALSDT